MTKTFCDNCEKEIPWGGSGSRHYVGNGMVAGRLRPIYAVIDDGGLCPDCWPIAIASLEGTTAKASNDAA